MPCLRFKKSGTIVSFFLLTLMSNTLPAIHGKPVNPKIVDSTSKSCTDCQKTVDACQCDHDHEGIINQENKGSEAAGTKNSESQYQSRPDSSHCCSSCNSPLADCECVKEKPRTCVEKTRARPDCQLSTSSDSSPPAAKRLAIASTRGLTPMEGATPIPRGDQIAFQLPEPGFHPPLPVLTPGETSQPRLEPALSSEPGSSIEVSVGQVSTIPVEYPGYAYLEEISDDDEPDVDHLSSLLTGHDVQAILVIPGEMDVLNQFEHMLHDFTHSPGGTDFQAITDEAVAMFDDYSPTNILLQGTNPRPHPAHLYLFFVTDGSLIRLMFVFRNRQTQRLLYVFINTLAVVQTHISEPEGLSSLIKILKKQNPNEQEKTASGSFPGLYIISMDLTVPIEGLETLWEVATTTLENAIAEGEMILERLETDGNARSRDVAERSSAPITEAEGFDVRLREQFLSEATPIAGILFPFNMDNDILSMAAHQSKGHLLGSETCISIFGGATFQQVEGIGSDDCFHELNNDDSEYLIVIIPVTASEAPLIMFVRQFGGMATVSLHTFSDVLSKLKEQTTNQRLTTTDSQLIWEILGKIMRRQRDKARIKIFRQGKIP